MTEKTIKIGSHEHDNIVLSAHAQKYAVEAHRNTNHFYDNYLPYEFHLRMVVGVAHQFISLIPVEKQGVVLAACWMHDMIEDARFTSNDVKNIVGEEVADIVYALTNEKGKNRKERGNEKYYDGIRNTPYATFVKLCDRIANVQYSRMKYFTYIYGGKNMFDMYAKENTAFVEKLWCREYKDLFNYLALLCDSPPAKDYNGKFIYI